MEGNIIVNLHLISFYHERGIYIKYSLVKTMSHFHITIIYILAKFVSLQCATMRAFTFQNIVSKMGLTNVH